MSVLINRQDNLEFLCDQLRAGGAPLAVDTEFISERRYVPRLCLVQVFAETAPDVVEALIDPFAVNLAPFAALMADPNVLKIVHAGGQDLQIFAGEFQIAPQNVFDTQIAAAFLGYGHQIGYADMVRRIVGGPQINKAQQYTDWAARPLSPQQMEYALDDVRYLPEVWRTLRKELVTRGRLPWAETEFRRAETRASSPPEASEVYRKFNLSGMSRRQLANLRELCMARELLARESDKPASFIIPDATVLQLAKHPAASAGELRATRGMPSLPNSSMQIVQAALDRAADLPPEEYPQRLLSERPDPRSEAVISLLGALVQLRAAQHDISRTYLAPRDQLAALASWWLRGDEEDDEGPPDLPLLHDWRGELLGRELLEFLQGHLALTFDQSARSTPGAPADQSVVKTVTGSW